MVRGQHTQHIHNERGMGWRREWVARMREIKVKLKDEVGEARMWVV